MKFMCFPFSGCAKHQIYKNVVLSAQYVQQQELSFNMRALILQAANPELSMAQIQQLTALAFARDDLARPPQPPTPAPASQSDASHNDGPSGNGFEPPQGDPTQSPNMPPSGQGNASGSMTLGAPAGATMPAGSSAAAAAVDFAHARSDGSEWAAGFIAEARQQNEANSDAVTSLSGEFMPHCALSPVQSFRGTVVALRALRPLISSCHFGNTSL